MVFQDAGLFNRSIAENIRVGRPDATDAEVEEAARLAEAHDFIAKKPGGYQFVIGERGASLSGGERQRIAIARAILKNAPILILDEATSALDVETEARIKRALDRLRKGRTTFIIAHRLSTVANADLILVLDGGRIVERGTFRELVAQQGPVRAAGGRGRLHRAGRGGHGGRAGRHPRTIGCCRHCLTGSAAPPARGSKVEGSLSAPPRIACRHCSRTQPVSSSIRLPGAT